MRDFFKSERKLGLQERQKGRTFALRIEMLFL